LERGWSVGGYEKKVDEEAHGGKQRKKGKAPTTRVQKCLKLTLEPYEDPKWIQVALYAI
jgi:hypothetical protein